MQFVYHSKIDMLLRKCDLDLNELRCSVHALASLGFLWSLETSTTTTVPAMAFLPLFTSSAWWHTQQWIECSHISNTYDSFFFWSVMEFSSTKQYSHQYSLANYIDFCAFFAVIQFKTIISPMILIIVVFYFGLHQCLYHLQSNMFGSSSV